VITTEPGRILVRVDADALDATYPGDGSGLIDVIRAGDQPTMIAVMLDDRAGPTRAVAAEANGVTRVTIDVAGQPAPNDAAALPAAPAAAPPAASAPPPLIAASQNPLQTIVIDPGHGGDDAGARGPRGTEEKTIALDVARRLRTLLETRLGIRVILTRDDDRTISLDERAAVANNSKADVFVSLHLNTSPVASVAGAQVYYVRLDREGEDVRRAAATEAVALQVLGGATRSIDVIQWDFAQARHVEASAVFAGIIEGHLRAAQVRMNARPRLDAPLRVLTGANMPAALIEMAYLSNGEQERLVQQEAYQSSLAQGLFNAVVGFRSHLESQRTP
jgi:N-acetylmuramoyl-L-alanine amidase